MMKPFHIAKKLSNFFLKVKTLIYKVDKGFKEIGMLPSLY